MPAPRIPDSILGLTRKLTPSEISIYNIDCGAGGSLQARRFFKSAWPELDAYVFELPSCGMDADGLFTLTIRYRAQQNIPVVNQNPQRLNNTQGGKRKKRNTRRRRV